MKMNFEVIISKFQNRYKAICPAFSECIGEGDCEDEAVEDLGNAITLHLSDTVRKTLDDIKQLGLLRRLPEVDQEKTSGIKDSFAQNKKPVIKNGKMLFSGKLPLSSDWLHKVDNKRQSGQKIKKILGIGSISGLGPLPLSPSLLDELHSPLQAELLDEGLMFGVPLSLN